MAALVLALGGCKGDRGDAGATGPNPQPAAPGQNLGATLTAARITGDNHLQVDYTLTDAGANPASTEGVANSWTAAVLGRDEASGLPAWKSLTVSPTPVTGAAGSTNQPATDQNGKVEDLGGGNFRYTFGSTLQSPDRSATHRIGLFTRRPRAGVANAAEAPDFDIANAVLDFVPAGGNPAPRDLVSMASCNACHGILQAHGGFRRDVRLCTTCHTTQLFDPDTHDTGDPSQMNPLDLGRMVHRIHRGRDLPTVQAAAQATPPDFNYKYHVIGFRSSDNVYGAVIKNPNPTAATTTPAVVGGVGFPQDLRNCAVCHTATKDAQGNVTAGAQAEQWQTAVSRRTCQGCHDSSWFNDANPPKYHVLHGGATNPPVAAGTNPTTPAGVPTQGPLLTTDSGCTTCHSQNEMVRYHTAPNLSSAFNPITLKINSTRVSGSTLTVNFTATNKDGSPITSLAALSSASANASGPTSDYQVPPTFVTTANLITTATATGTPGTYEVPLTLPAGATGSWAVGLEMRRVNPTLTASERKLGNLGPTATAYDFAPQNPVAYFNAAGTGAATARRQVVTSQDCNTCHQVLSIHGSLRHSPEYCVLCHAPNATDKPGAGGSAGTAGTGRPPGTPGAAADVASTVDKLAERSIHLKPMIHQIHTGEELDVTRPFVIYGFGRSVNFMGEARFPGTRARCDACHSPRAGALTYTVDAIPSTAQPTRAMQWTASVVDGNGVVASPGTTADVPPITAACISCHDSPAAHAHAEQQILNFGTPQVAEGCAVCHGEGADFAVTKVHAPFIR